MNLNFLRRIKQKLFKKRELSLINTGFVTCGDVRYLSIGERVSFGGNVLLYLNESITIGDDTMIAINVTIHTSTHDHLNNPMWQYRVDRPVKIGSHVWIGLNAIILPGVIIDDFAVVAAGSVINRNVPKGAIVAGNPARIIKYRDLSKTILDSDIEYPGNVIKGYFITEFIKEKK